MTAPTTRKPGIVIVVPPIGSVSEPPIVHSTTMKVMADSDADTMPTTNSTGDSVASRRSSAIRYSGFCVVALDEVELVVAAIAEPAIDHVTGEPAAPAPLRRHAQVDQDHPGRTLATASTGKIIAWNRTTSAFLFSSASKITRFQTVSWYWMTS